MAVINGKVERKSHNEKYGSHGILVAGTWYNSKYPIKAEIGDLVRFEDQGKRYVRDLAVLGSETSEPEPSLVGPEAILAESANVSLNRDRCILRQNALGHATSIVGLFSPRETKPEDAANEVIRVAKILEGYSSGDDDLAVIGEELGD